jgi:hypothetical protein
MYFSRKTWIHVTFTKIKQWGWGLGLSTFTYLAGFRVWVPFSALQKERKVTQNNEILLCLLNFGLQLATGNCAAKCHCGLSLAVELGVGGALPP